MSSKSGALELPNGWSIASLGEVADWGSGGTPRRSEPSFFSGNIPWVTISDLGDGPVLKTRESISESGLKASAAKLVPKGAILVALYGSIGKLGITTEIATTNQAIAHASPNHAAFHELYLFHYLRSQREQLAELGTGVTQKNIYLGDLKAFDIPVAPRAEQGRVVDKLEELLSELDSGVAELKGAQRKLARYRQSLLKAAVEGALTADWRAARTQRGQAQETGPELLQRILAERRARWEAKQSAKFAEQGKIPPNGWQAKYPDPGAPDATDLPALPEGWVWATLDQLTEFVTSGSRGWANYYADSGATFIRSQNINKDRLDLSDIAFVNPPRNSEGARTRVQRDDLLLTITGANVGKSAWVHVELEEAYVSQHVALIRPIESSFSAYLHLFLTCKAGGRGQLDKRAYGAGKPGLNLQQVLSVVVPLPGPEELPVLLDAIASALHATVAQTTEIDHALKQAAAQRKNILKAAFAGQLVPQDPNDEPASVLLDRIRAQRAAAGPRTTKRGRKARENA